MLIHPDIFFAANEVTDNKKVTVLLSCIGSPTQYHLVNVNMYISLLW